MDGISGAMPTEGRVSGVDVTPLPRPRMVLIDLDGTLVDTVPDLAYAVDVMMQRLGLPVRGEPAVRAWIGNGAERLVKRALLRLAKNRPPPDYRIPPPPSKRYIFVSPASYASPYVLSAYS